MPEIKAEGEGELTRAVEEALERYFSLSAAVRLPGRAAWARLVEQIVVPVSERLYRAAAAVVSGEALEAFLDGVRRRLTDESTLIEDIERAVEQHGDEAASLDWAGADGQSTPWRSRAALIGGHEAQVTPMQAAQDSASAGARKRWVAREDNRVRPAHHAADGQTVAAAEPFSVGGESLMYPGDPNGSAENVLNCRCELEWIAPEGEDTMSAALLTAAVTIDMNAPLAPRDTAWDGADANKKLRAWASDGDSLDAAKMAKGFLWADPEEAPSTWKLPVATVVDGRLTLVWKGITAAAAALQGARSPIDLPDADKEKVRAALTKLYAKAAKEFDDEGIVPPWAPVTKATAAAALSATLAHMAETDPEVVEQTLLRAQHDLLEASVKRKGGAWRPEASWFQPPTETDKARIAEGEQPLVSDNGRILGYVAPWRQPDGRPTMHVGYLDAGEYIAVPGQQDYSYFHQNNINYPLSDGTSGHVGIITDAGHPTDIDNPRHQAALVRVGEDENGVWIAGAVFPDVVEDQMRFSRMKASAISGEWDLRTGQFRGAAMVNHPGFPQPTTRGQDFYALAASLKNGSPMNRAGVEAAVRVLQSLLAAADTEDAPRTQRDATQLHRASSQFLKGMLEHHRMGVTMGREYLDLPEDERNPEVTELAETILSEQTAQVSAMEKMLRDAGDEVPPEGDMDDMKMDAAKDKMPEFIREKIRKREEEADGDTPDSEEEPEDTPDGESPDNDDSADDRDSEEESEDKPRKRRKSMSATHFPEELKPEDRALFSAAVSLAKEVLGDATVLSAAQTAFKLRHAETHGIALPSCLEILSSYLAGEEESSIQQARAASLKAAEAICRSNDPKHATVRLKACRLVHEYRSKAGI